MTDTRSSMSPGASIEALTLSRQARMTGTIAFVDGITRAGKSMLGPILASFDRVEIERLEEIVEYIGTSYSMGKIARDAAVAILRMQTDMHLYNSMLGRNTNYRFSDHSSVWKNPNRLRNFRRLRMREGDATLERIRRERPIYQNMTHDQLMNFDLLKEAFGSDLRIVEMIRHPVDLVDSWTRRGLGTRFGQDPLVLTFCIRYKDQDLPYFAQGWEDVYLSTTPTGRVIRMIQWLWDNHQNVYDSLTANEKKQVFYVSLGRFVQDPQPYLQPLAEFVGTETTKHTRRALKGQNCPRRISIEERVPKRESIEQQASDDELKIVQRLIEEYEALAAEFSR